jgi:transcriptional regulator with XRE-family HTH domain
MSDFSEQLDRLRAERGMSLHELARRSHYDVGYLSKVINGHKRGSRELALRLDKLLGAGGQIVAAWDAIARLPISAVSSTGDDAASRVMSMRLSTLSPAQTEDLIGHLTDQWHALVKTDNLLGPRHALGAVLDNLGVVAALLRTVRAPARREVIRLGARYAESAAWLYEDSGALESARYWTGRSMEWAVEAGDHLMASWTLFRRSQQAAADHDPAQVAGLAAAARRENRDLPGPMLAAILQQEAYAHALDRSETACHDALDQAHALAAAPDDPGDASNGHGSFCTPAYLEVQRGACWLMLGNPAAAVAAFQTAICSLAPTYRRDRGMALSGYAAALAAVGEPGEAAAAATQALGIGRDSGSGRILRMVIPVAEALKPYNHLDSVAGLRAELAETPAV